MTNAREREASLFLADVPEVAGRLWPAMIAYVGVYDPGGAREGAFLSESGTLVGVVDVLALNRYRRSIILPSKWLN